ncbi:hypothetical protein AYI74_04240 [Shewanella algae]|uniref:hypothetical protein n=1 Tax=Shewanella algae TaxID=38313 RepID=UPI000D1A9D21|nr:hypothetical protein [Shewanella algae]PSS73189.1 hypothetical protein AYI88_08175 [Shewanella algae]TWU69639.1 hypothetical protein AYI74_04240 [Shewanella algae]
MDKTVGERQQRYREQITKGERKRLQFVISKDEANKLEKICTLERISKTDFLRNVIKSWAG